MGKILSFDQLIIGKRYRRKTHPIGPCFDIHEGQFVLAVVLDELYPLDRESFSLGPFLSSIFIKEQFYPILLSFQFSGSLDIVEVNFNAKAAAPRELEVALRSKKDFQFCLICEDILQACFEHSLHSDAWEIFESGIKRQLQASYGQDTYMQHLTTIYQSPPEEIVAQGAIVNNLT